MTNDRRALVAELLPKKGRRKTRIGLVAGGLGAFTGRNSPSSCLSSKSRQASSGIASSPSKLR